VQNEGEEGATEVVFGLSDENSYRNLITLESLSL